MVSDSVGRIYKRLRRNLARTEYIHKIIKRRNMRLTFCCGAVILCCCIWE